MTNPTRVRWSRKLFALGLFGLATLTLLAEPATGGEPAKLNILFITADDMNHDSAGCYGCVIPGLTPNLDRLATDGMRFHYAYSTVAVCQPVREIMHTGLYPHRNGAMGFFPLKSGVRTLNQQLHDAGYLISMIGKNPHYQPAEHFCVDFAESQISRSPARLAEVTKKFVGMARAQQRPFFHHVNCTDPHRPFIGAKGADDLAHGDAPSRWVKPEEVPAVPGFLEDLPEVRQEVAQYYTSVRRLDDCVGAVLQALQEAGAADNTLVMFYGGDHGMSFPFAKSNDYENSSRGALILRWPGVIKPGGVDREHLVSTLDFTPTLLDAARLPPIPGVDGRSFLPALRGEAMTGWDRVFTCYNQSAGREWLLMRCVRTKERSYIWNAWCDGKTEYHAENMGGLTWNAMLAAAESNPAIKERTDFYLHRTPEEFYDMTNDRCERRNLIQDPARQGEIENCRKELLALMERTGDPLAEAFAHRDQPELLAAAKQQLRQEYERPAKGKGKGKGRGEARKVAKEPGEASTLLEFSLPDSAESTEPVSIAIRHHFPAASGEQPVTVTMLAVPGKQRLDRVVMAARGEGEIRANFDVPAERSGKEIRFAAFVGTDFAKTPQHIQSEPVPVK